MPSSKRPGEEMESASRKKNVNASRTGQACDRCKVRKIRCDARLGGCSPCLQNNTECKTTDRITGRPIARGHTETLETENTNLKMYMVELQQQLREHGVEPKQQAPSVQSSYIPTASVWMQGGQQQQGSWGDLSSSGLLPAAPQTERHNSQGSLLPEFRPGCIGDNYLGVASGSDMLSPIEGTQLSLFGMKIDLAEFLPPETDPDSDPMSYRTFLLHTFRKSKKVLRPALPGYETCRALADYYFKSVQNFVPIVHKPDFFHLLYRIHHEGYQPSIQETVTVHMVLAIMKFQWAMRNGDKQAHADAMSHYHYSLGFVPDLIIGHQLRDIQALALICCQLRSQPRLGATWQFTNMVLGLAIELGLHRSANAWQGDNAEQNTHIIEMRKRVFWALMVIHVSVSGKLGRPMPLRLEDFDIEMPEHVSDNLPHEAHLSKWRKCSFRAAIPGMKLLKILMQVYSTVYSVRASTEPYETSVRRLEKELGTFREQMLPPELSGGPQTVEEDRTPALYLLSAELEIRLVLHHPSLCRTLTTEVMAKNLDICLETSRKLLSAAVGLKNLKSLDSTWYYTTDYLAAIFTTLFAWTQRQDQMSSADLQQLRTDMDQWLDIMGDVGVLLGSGARLREALRGIVDTSLANVGRHLAAKTASAGLASSGSPVSATNGEQSQQMYQGANGYHHSYAEGTANPNMGNQQSYTGAEQHQSQHRNHYPPPNQYYSGPQPETMPTYPGMGQFDANPYQGEDAKPNLDGPLNPHIHPSMSQPPPPQPAQHPNFMAAFQQPPAPQSGYDAGAQSLSMSYSGPAAWRSFTDNMMTNMSGGQDYMSPANALMSLGGEKHVGMEMASIGGVQMPENAQQQHWPAILYHPGAADGQG
ncbi:hypothetical protein LTR37_000145 [Vermiconidia calcicola]|uniref:Uncharacterized protein n=1 Tax=Vermiconidia calcicola TaxID=1690605 RepID=A0ACC3NZ76_9PEZI|nr:hypothetical protein LTR37_000145 [Vermiconidia calcicola]